MYDADEDYLEEDLLPEDVDAFEQSDWTNGDDDWTEGGDDWYE